MLTSLLAAFSVLALSLASPIVAQPYLYMTQHGGKSGINQVFSFDLDGTPRSTAVLTGDHTAAGPAGLRSGLVMPDGRMLLNNAAKTNSRIVLYDVCAQDGTRAYLGDWTTEHLLHPYGVTLGVDVQRGEPVVWITNQDTYDLVQFSTGGKFQKVVKTFPGTTQLRSVVYDQGIVYVSNEDENAVLAYDTRTGQFNDSLAFTNIVMPIGLYVDSDARLLFVGSNYKPDGGVQAYSLDSRKLVQTFEANSLEHPAGMVSRNDTLWVLSQDTNKLLSFNVTTGEKIDTLVKNIPDAPEQLWFSQC